ncbi:MAG: N-formylglutamate deformylase [Burkholderiales bacterium]|nr:MAG: N-formylglutamate deformylase [Burkholderiales bacterium]
MKPDNPPFTLRRGAGPLIVSMPHAGTLVPPELAARLTPAAAILADTDWHLPQVYDFLDDFDATVLVATHSRLVVDLNRPPDGASLYPGQSVTGLVPVDTFRNEPVYAGQPPDADEVAARRRDWWQPYHDALAREIERLKAMHARVTLWDAHSIASVLPRFFEGRLPDLNFGTADAAACDAALIDAVLAPVQAQREYGWVLNGRFKGGYITRRYGAPARGVHAVQLEMTQAIYMDERPPFALQPDRCERLRPLLRACVGAMHAWASAA